VKLYNRNFNRVSLWGKMDRIVVFSQTIVMGCVLRHVSIQGILVTTKDAITMKTAEYISCKSRRDRDLNSVVLQNPILPDA
jgi:hypothetical protein